MMTKSDDEDDEDIIHLTKFKLANNNLQQVSYYDDEHDDQYYDDKLSLTNMEKSNPQHVHMYLHRNSG